MPSGTNSWRCVWPSLEVQLGFPSLPSGGELPRCHMPQHGETTRGSVRDGTGFQRGGGGFAATQRLIPCLALTLFRERGSLKAQNATCFRGFPHLALERGRPRGLKPWPYFREDVGKLAVAFDNLQNDHSP